MSYIWVIWVVWMNWVFKWYLRFFVTDENFTRVSLLATVMHLDRPGSGWRQRSLTRRLSKRWKISTARTAPWPRHDGKGNRVNRCTVALTNWGVWRVCSEFIATQKHLDLQGLRLIPTQALVSFRPRAPFDQERCTDKTSANTSQNKIDTKQAAVIRGNVGNVGNV